MASIYLRKLQYWARIRTAPKKWKSVKTPYVDGQEEIAQRHADELQRLVDGESTTPAANHEMTVSVYAQRWLEDRRRSGVRSVNDDQARLELHVLPTLGKFRLVDVRPRQIRDLVKALRQADKLAARTIRNVYGVTSTLFKTAVADELLATSPCVLGRGELPKKADADPEWRATAIFTREEVELLVSSDKLLPDRRVLYALKAVAALRHSEAATLRWSQVDSPRKPLGAIVLSHTKTDVPREVPIHPTLAKILATWKATGWRAIYGRAPKPNDLVVPTRAMTVRAAAASQKTFVEDLELLELRRRRGHDLRRTFITLARVDGARTDLLEVVTHGPRGAIVDLYTTFPWPALCEEVAKLRVTLRRGEVLRLATSLATRSANARKRWKKLASPTGFENVADLQTARELKAAQGVTAPAKVAEGHLGRLRVARLATRARRAIRVGDLLGAVALLDEALRRTLELQRKAEARQVG